MKQLCTVLPTAALGVGAITVLAAGREARHRVVFEETVEGAEQWTGVLNNVENVQKSFGATETDIEVVAHGNGLGLVTNTNVSLKERMQRIASRGVVFAACENTIERRNDTCVNRFRTGSSRKGKCHPGDANNGHSGSPLHDILRLGSLQERIHRPGERDNAVADENLGPERKHAWITMVIPAQEARRPDGLRVHRTDRLSAGAIEVKRTAHPHAKRHYIQREDCRV
ncbi:MAG TPA: hypothetical protein VGA56_23450, partial [Opitutaceae bacterium]